MAKWIKACNGKQTRYVNSSWRPAELNKRVRVVESTKEMPGAVLAELKAGESKSLVFVHSKAAGEQICRKLNESGVKSAFYHAGLSAALRKRILDDFRSGMVGLDTLVCTSSLSAGVTL